jgi:hypothetical protein
MFESKQEEMELVEPLPWHSVITVADTWFWLQHGLLPDLWKEDSLVMASTDLRPGAQTNPFNNSNPIVQSIENRPGRLRMTNQMIGGLRLWQKRYKPVDCESNEKLREFYGQKCRGVDPQTEAYGPGKTSKVNAFIPAEGAENGIFHAYFDIGRRLTEPSGPLEDIEYLLRPNNWIDSNTESVEFQAAYFNAEIQMFVLMRIKFDFELGGYMGKVEKVEAISANIYGDPSYFIFDVIWFVMLLLLLLQEGGEVIRAKKRRVLNHYF